MGTGPFAAPMAETLFDSAHEVAAVVTQPERAAVGKRPPPMAPVRRVALERGATILDPVDVNADESRSALAALAPDLLVVADYGQILKAETLAVARLGGINLHGSLLPRYRGAAPINWAIFRGETTTGVTVIAMNARVDAGACLARAELAIEPDENAVELETRLARLGAPLVLSVIDDLEAGRARPIAQDTSQATTARRLRKSDGEVDWRRTAAELRDQVRALEPWPRTSTHWRPREGEPSRLILSRVAVEPLAADAPPGTVVEAAGDRLLIATGDGALRILELQPAGKRNMTAAEFLRGHAARRGDRFDRAG